MHKKIEKFLKLNFIISQILENVESTCPWHQVDEMDNITEKLGLK